MKIKNIRINGTDYEIEGKSAYELYKEAHPEYTGTLEEWLDSLKGEPGESGVEAASEILSRKVGNAILSGGKKIAHVDFSQDITCYASTAYAAAVLYEGEVVGGGTYTFKFDEITSNTSDANATYDIKISELKADGTVGKYHAEKGYDVMPYIITTQSTTVGIRVHVNIRFSLTATEKVRLSCYGFEVWKGNIYLNDKYFSPANKITTKAVETVIVGNSGEYIINGELLELGTSTSSVYTPATAETEVLRSFPVCTLTDLTAGEKLRFIWDEVTLDIPADIASLTYTVATFNEAGTAKYSSLDSEGRYTVEANIVKVIVYAQIKYTNLASGRNTKCTVKGLVVTKGGDLYLNEKAVRIKAVEKLNRDRLTPNDTYYANGVIRRCFNPYKDKTAESEALVGQLHVHSKFKNDNGDWQYYATSDENLCKVHSENGYDFITITDYYHNGEVTQAPANTHGLIWLCNSQETSVDGNSGNIGQHMCVYHSPQVFALPKNMSPEAVARKVTADGCSCSLAHPSLSGLYQTPEKVGNIYDKIRFCELYNGHSKLHQTVKYPEGKASDYAWEIMLDNGCLTWGIAVSDAHAGSNANRDITNGCVKVFCQDRNRLSIWESLCKGNFISCSEVNTEIPDIAFIDGVLTIGVTDAQANVAILKEKGEIVHSGTGSTSYTLTGDEQYIRAVITLSSGFKIWTQPIVNSFSTDIY